MLIITPWVLAILVIANLLNWCDTSVFWTRPSALFAPGHQSYLLEGVTSRDSSPMYEIRTLVHTVKDFTIKISCDNGIQREKTGTQTVSCLVLALIRLLDHLLCISPCLPQKVRNTKIQSNIQLQALD